MLTSGVHLVDFINGCRCVSILVPLSLYPLWVPISLYPFWDFVPHREKVEIFTLCGLGIYSMLADSKF